MALFSRELRSPHCIFLEGLFVVVLLSGEQAAQLRWGLAGAFLCLAGSRPGRAQPCRMLLQWTATLVKGLLLQVIVSRRAKSGKWRNELTCWGSACAVVALCGGEERAPACPALPSQLPFASSQQGPILSLAFCGPASWLDWLLSVSIGPRSLQNELPLYPFKSLTAWEAAALDGEPGVAAPLVPLSGWPSPKPLGSQRGRDAPVQTCPQVPETTAWSNWAGIETTLLFFFSSHP